MVIGKKYNWKNQKERLIYLGNNFSGNGYWHQFAKVETPNIVWCECLDSDLIMIEETKIEARGEPTKNQKKRARKAKA